MNKLINIAAAATIAITSSNAMAWGSTEQDATVHILEGAFSGLFNSHHEMRSYNDHKGYHEKMGGHHGHGADDYYQIYKSSGSSEVYSGHGTGSYHYSGRPCRGGYASGHC